MKKANLYKQADVLEYESGNRTLTLNYNGRYIVAELLEIESKELHSHDYAEGMCRFESTEAPYLTFHTQCELVREGQEWLPINPMFTTVNVDQPEPEQLFRKFIEDIQQP